MSFLDKLQEVLKMCTLAADGLCPFCQMDMKNATRGTFKDDKSYKEFLRTGLCQSCQECFDE